MPIIKTLLGIAYFAIWVNFITRYSYYELDNHAHIPHICTDVYWGYTAFNSTFSVKFEAAAPPTDSASSWVAWGLNPTGSDIINTQLFVLSLDSKRTLSVNMYNLSSYQEAVKAWSFYGDVVKYKSSFELSLMKFEAQIVLPENTNTVNHVVISGNSFIDGKPDLHDVNLNLYELLDLTNASKSSYLKMVNRYSRELTFQKGCILGKKEASFTWEEYLTPRNFNVVDNYALLLVLMCHLEGNWKVMFMAKMYIYMRMIYISLRVMHDLMNIKADEGTFFV